MNSKAERDRDSFPMKNIIESIKKEMDLEEHNKFQKLFKGDNSKISSFDSLSETNSELKLKGLPIISDQPLLLSRPPRISKKKRTKSIIRMEDNGEKNLNGGNEINLLNSSKPLGESETRRIEEKCIPTQPNSVLKKSIQKLRKSVINKTSGLNQFQFDLINDLAHFSEFHAPNKQKTPLMIWSPVHPFMILMKILSFFLILFLFFYIPFDIAFAPKLFWKGETLRQITIIFLILKMVTNLNAGHFKDGILIKDRSRIMLHYLKNYFLIDMIGLFSIASDFLIEHSSDNSFTPETFSKSLFFFKVLEFKKLYFELSHYFKLDLHLKGMKQIIEILCLSIFLAHFIACLWYLTTDLTAYYYSNHSKVWLMSPNILNAPWQTQYLYSFYWAVVVMMTVGFGDITPTNAIEVVFCIFAIFVGCAMYAYNINRIGLIMQQMYREETEFQEEFRIINNFLERKKIDSNLQSRVNEYLKFIWTEKKTQHNSKEMEIIQTLNENLREELLLESYGGILKAFPLLYQRFTEKTLKNMVNFIKELRFVPGDYIFYEKEEDDCCLYYINKGKVEFLIEETQKNVINKCSIENKHEGQVFGEASFFTGDPRAFSARCKDFVSIFAIKRQDFINIVQKNSADYEEFCMIKDTLILNKENQLFPKDCSACKSRNHTPLDCEILHYIPDKEKIIKIYEFSHFQDRGTLPQLRRHRSQNSLCLVSKNMKTATKIQKLIKKDKSLLELKKAFSISKEIDGSFDSLMEDEDESSSEEPISKRKEDSLVDQKEKRLSIDGNEELGFKEKFKKEKTNKPRKSLMSQDNNPIPLLKYDGSNVNLKDTVMLESGVVTMTTKAYNEMTGFEKFEIFENYFPECNLTNIIYEVNKTRLKKAFFRKMSPLKDQKERIAGLDLLLEINEPKNKRLKDLEKYSFFAQHYREKIAGKTNNIGATKREASTPKKEKITHFNESPFFKKYIQFHQGFSLTKVVEELLRNRSKTNKKNKI